MAAGNESVFNSTHSSQPINMATSRQHPYPQYHQQVTPVQTHSHSHHHHQPYPITPHPSQQHQTAHHLHPYPPPAAPANAAAGPSRLPITSERRLSRVLGHIAHLRKLDQESIDKRREKRHAYRHKEDEGHKVEVAQACVTCRKAKTKCLNRDGEPCARCAMAGEKCTYPPQKKRGRRTDTSLQDLLDQVENEITTILISSTSSTNDEERSAQTEPAPSSLPSDPDDETHTALQNPLGVLATAAIDQSVEENQGGPASYWNSIYAVKAESDFSQDPVLIGILTEDDLTRLVTFYFNNLRPFFMHLDPVVHTPSFLRLNSPFLTSAIASVAATFDNNSRHLAAPITTHAHNLASRAFAEGYKSLEVVQAYLMILHWAARFPPYWSEDKSWAYQGQAMRLACEIRLDLPPNKDTLSSYRFTRQLTEDETERLLACRGRTYLLVSLSEIAMASQTGRADTTSGHRLLRPPTIPYLPPGDSTNERFVSSTRLNHIFARALHHWHNAGKDNAGKGEREKFMLSWRRDLDDWHDGRRDTADRLVEIHGTNHHIMLILLTLRIRGSHETTMDLLRRMNQLAVHLISIVFQWFQEGDFYGPGGLAYAHDFLIVNIAYAAVLVRKLSKSPQPSIDIDANAHIEQALVVLDNIVVARPNVGLSTAGLLAAQIRRMCQATETTPQTYPDFAFLQSPQRQLEFDFTFPSFPSFDENDPLGELLS